jgi:thiosulfate reductase cytochrome b subunit
MAQGQGSVSMEGKLKIYPFYERLWHWTQTLAVLVLLVTGAAITYSGLVRPVHLGMMISAHNIAGVVLALNAGLALFYNLSTGLIRQYLPGISDVFPKSLKQANYYLLGIFQGAPHPFEKTPDQRLLPVQKITYFMLLNVLLPLMIVTGAVRLGAYYYPPLNDQFGGLWLIATLHRFGAWLFLSFMIVHHYMITTGKTIFSYLISMITGYESTGSGKEEK